MSCKKEGCCRQTPPRAEMTVMPDWVISQLISVAQTGFKNLIPWPNESVRALAEKIAALVIENETLRKLLNNNNKPAVTVDAAQLTIAFGPDNRYTLCVPANDEKLRKQLAQSLLAAAEQLQTQKPMTLPCQLDLPFCE